MDRAKLSNLFIPLAAFLFLFIPTAFPQTWEQYVDGQIKHKQEMELEEKKIEVLARMQQLGASNIDVENSSGSRAYASGVAAASNSNTNTNERDRAKNGHRTRD
jgi:hypothetical protein